jgi:5-methylcytosine-specific restriction endonuclease McrA
MTREEEAYPNQRIYERDKFKCRYCGFDGLKDFESWHLAHFNVDHIRSVSRGGEKDDDNNLVLACHACNAYKWNFDCKTFEEAVEVIKSRKAIAEKWYRKYVLKLDL